MNFENDSFLVDQKLSLRKKIDSESFIQRPSVEFSIPKEGVKIDDQLEKMNSDQIRNQFELQNRFLSPSSSLNNFKPKKMVNMDDLTSRIQSTNFQPTLSKKKFLTRGLIPPIVPKTNEDFMTGSQFIPTILTSPVFQTPIEMNMSERPSFEYLETKESIPLISIEKKIQEPVTFQPKMIEKMDLNVESEIRRSMILKKHDASQMETKNVEFNVDVPTFATQKLVHKPFVRSFSNWNIKNHPSSYRSVQFTPMTTSEPKTVDFNLINELVGNQFTVNPRLKTFVEKRRSVQFSDESTETIQTVEKNEEEYSEGFEEGFKMNNQRPSFDMGKKKMEHVRIPDVNDPLYQNWMDKHAFQKKGIIGREIKNQRQNVGEHTSENVPEINLSSLQMERVPEEASQNPQDSLNWILKKFDQKSKSNVPSKKFKSQTTYQLF